VYVNRLQGRIDAKDLKVSGLAGGFSTFPYVRGYIEIDGGVVRVALERARLRASADVKHAHEITEDDIEKYEALEKNGEYPIRPRESDLPSDRFDTELCERLGERRNLRTGEWSACP
jgi:hypothetical protein